MIIATHQTCIAANMLVMTSLPQLRGQYVVPAVCGGMGRGDDCITAAAPGLLPATRSKVGKLSQSVLHSVRRGDIMAAPFVRPVRPA